MTGDQLATSLRELVREHGLEQVSRSLHEIGGSSDQSQGTVPSSGRPVQRASSMRGQRRRAVSALERVEKMDLPSETADSIRQLAKKFDEKSFMPTFGDIARFCRVYGIEEPRSRSRASAISRVFATIAAMDTEDIRTLLDYGAFSGPSRLRPISDAIARSSGTRA